MKALPIEITMSMVRANSAVKIAGPRHGTTSIRTFGASLGDLLHQRRHQQLDRQIRHHQAKLALASRGVEIVGDEQRAHLVERLRQRARAAPAPAASAPSARRCEPGGDRRSRSRSRCSAWLAAGCDSPIRIAARLTLASLSRRVERDQQIEVKRIQIHEDEYISYLTIDWKNARASAR